ncbi:cytochrome p450 [Hirsutella rhossiliensis]
MFSTELSLLMELFKVTIPEQIRRAIRGDTEPAQKDRQSVILGLLESNLGPAEKTVKRLSSEANTLVAAGTETTASALNVLTYHLLSNPSVHERLRAELSTVATNATNLPSWSKLENMPYFGAVIREGLRLMYGIPSRLALIAPDEHLIYRGIWKSTEFEYVIPPGYAVGMSSYLLHTDERIFPDASQFCPQRWLDENGERNRDLEKYLLSFSKGSRQCLGIHLAYCELHITIAALVLRVMPHMRLYETSREEVEYDHDEGLAVSKKGSKGVRIVID